MVYMTITSNVKPMFLSVQDLLPMTTNEQEDLLQKETTIIKASLISGQMWPEQRTITIKSGKKPDSLASL